MTSLKDSWQTAWGLWHPSILFAMYLKINVVESYINVSTLENHDKLVSL